jgi:hypothetical protein
MVFILLSYFGLLKSMGCGSTYRGSARWCLVSGYLSKLLPTLAQWMWFRCYYRYMMLISNLLSPTIKEIARKTNGFDARLSKAKTNPKLMSMDDS